MYGLNGMKFKLQLHWLVEFEIKNDSVQHGK